VSCAVLVSGFHMSFATFAPGLVACIGMSGVMLMLATFRKVEFVRFKNDSGIVILDIARSGKSAAQLDSFVDALTKQIRETRGCLSFLLSATSRHLMSRDVCPQH